MIEIKAIVEGGKAKPVPALAQQLSAAKINIKEIIDTINEKTKDLDGMEVPITIKINEDKSYEISVGTPSVAALVKKELNVKKLAKSPFNIYEKDEVKEEFKESLKFEQVVKIAKMKIEDMKTNDLKNAVKQVVGFCVSAGVRIDSKMPKEVIKEINEGKYDQLLK